MRCHPALSLDAVPACLRARPQWVVWRYIERDGKLTKLPFQSRGGDPADSTDADTWSSFDQAVAAWEADDTLDGVGYVFAADDPYCGVDLDDALDREMGVLKPWAQAFVERLETYCEISPSGCGVKLFGIAAKPGDRCRTGYEDGAVEVYDRDRFFTVTGERWEGTPAEVRACQSAVTALYEQVFAAKRPSSTATAATALLPVHGARAAGRGGLTDEQILRKATRSTKSGGKFTDLWAGRWEGHHVSQSEADGSLVFRLAFYTKDPAQLDRMFRASGLMRPKWDERHGAKTYGRMTIDNALATVTGQWRPRTAPTGPDRPAHDAPRPEDVVESAEPMRVAEHYLARRRTRDGELTLRRYREQWWLFEDGGYRPLSDEVALADVYRHVDRLWTPSRNPWGDGAYRRVVARAATVGEVARAIPACGAIVDGPMPRWLDGRAAPRPEDVVAFRNGLLDTAAYCRGEPPRLLPLTPAWFAGVACPYDFDAGAGCPSWTAFLDEALDGDADSAALLQEWFGLNLVPDNRYERLMMLVGPPRAGKGTALEVMGAVLGEGQAATTSFAKLASRFGLAPLVGKLAAVLPDAHLGSGTDARAALEVLKSITGSDPQAVDRKGVDELPRVRLSCRFSIAVNELPKLPDEAGALKTRLLLLHFRNTFAGREDTTLKARLRGEAAGVAAWALRGLKRLRERGRFTVPPRSAAMVDAFEKIVSPVLGFLDDCCEVTVGNEATWAEKDPLYQAWCAWSKDRGSDPGSKADFGQSLLNANRGIASAKRGPRGQQFPVYAGVRLCR